jgi:hypothetical protein
MKTKQKTADNCLRNNSNPAALKFVVSRMLTKEPIEFKSIDDTASPLAQELFKFSYVKEVLSMKTIFQLPNMKSTTGKK